MQENIILIDQITSISNCYFGLKYNNSFVSIPSLPLKKRETDKETSSYHFDFDVLKMINKFVPDLYPNQYSCKEFNATLKPDSYMKLMLYRLQQHIMDGTLDQALKNIDKNANPRYRLEWAGNLSYDLPALKFEK